MKKINLLILPLIALSMIGCSRTDTSSTGNSTSEAPIEETSSTTTPDVSSSSPLTSSSTPVSSVEDSSLEESSESSSSFDPYSVGWSKKVTDMMLKYLGNTVLPYISLGKSSLVDADWSVSSSDYGILKIQGTAEWDSTSTPATLTTLYTNAGWTIETGTTNSFKATDATGKVHVDIGPASTSSYSADPTLTIKASYDEEYDKTAMTAWDSETTQLFQDNFGVVAPFVYLGTAYPSAEFSSYYGQLTITGGAWNAAVLTDAMTTLLAAGYSASITGQVLTATGKVSATSQDEFKIVIQSSGYSVKKISMVVEMTEYFDPSSQTDWTASVKSEMTTNLDGHEIPYLYLGTKNPTTYFWTSSVELDIRGSSKITSAQLDTILANSKTAFTDWTLKSDESASTGTKKITYQKTFSDNCTIKCVVTQSSSYGVIIECYLTEGLNIPSTSTAWSTATTNLMTTNLDGTVLPYVYLNSATESAAWDEPNLTITGGAWLKSIGDHVNDVYSKVKDDAGANVWTIELSDYDGSVTMSAKIGDARFNITVKKDYSSGNAVMTIKYTPKYSVPADCTSWTGTDVETAATQYFAGHDLPYVYLRTKTPTVYWSSYSNYLQIKGGEWDEEMITEMKKSYNEGNGWTIITDTPAAGTSAGVYKVSKDFGDGFIFKVQLTRYSSYTTIAEMTVYVEEYYTDANQPTAWDTTTAGKLSTLSYTIPYVYLASKNPSASVSTGYSSYLNRVDITGGNWSDQILASGKASLEAGGFTCYYSKSSYGSSVAGYKKINNTTFLAAQIFKNYSGKAEFYVFETAMANPTISTTGTWDETVKTGVQTYISDTTYMLPYLSLGDASTDVTYSTDTDHATLTSTQKLTHERAWVIYEQLKADGWNDLYIRDSASDLKVTANKTIESGAKLSLEIDNWSTAKCYLYYNPPFKAPEGVTDWSSAVTSLMTTNFGHTLPYFYIGADSPTATYSSYYNSVTIEGQTWNDAVYDNAIAAFEADKDVTTSKSAWTYMYDYSDDEYPILVATRAFSDGKHMTVKVIHYTYNSQEYPKVEVYCR